MSQKNDVFNLDLSCLIFQKGGRETETEKGKGKGGSYRSQRVRTTDRYKIRTVVPSAKQE